MYTNKYEKLTVKEFIQILSNIKDQNSEIVAIDFYNKDCQEIQGSNNLNIITILNNNGNLEHITIEQKEI